MKKKTDKKAQIVWKGSKEYRHDLYEGSIEGYMKNTSFKKGMVDIEKVDHKHIYHSIDSAGRKQQYTSTIGGHFHEITVVEDENGTKVVCGPPIRHVNVKTPAGVKRFKRPVEWTDSMSGMDEKKVDEHVHHMEYIESDMINPDHRKKSSMDLQRDAIKKSIGNSGYDMREM